ncbi:MAG: DUF4834 family protein [Chitinophagaceae bacterium]|nr:DUF4834 family protein [Chitinophagaceae bacterium]MCW5929679.1 DUF4834 family protein [Chitinophagaceae bacterium]
MKYIFYILLIYLLYRFIRFMIPMVRAGRQFKKQFGEMQQRMQEQMRQNSSTFQAESGQPTQKSANKSSFTGEYIDFEEVK